MKKTILPSLFALLLLANNQLNAQNVNIPDANFKAALVADAAINTNGDTEIQVSEAQAFTGAMFVVGDSIVSMTGIEAFTALTTLICFSNQLTSLNVSSNTALTWLDCYNNQLTSLNVSANTALTILDCSSNQLTSLDLSTNTALTTLSCSSNPLTTLNVSANTALTWLWCNSNQITSLNLSANTALTYLECGGNQLTSLNVSANTALYYLHCQNNQLTTLNVKNGNNINMSNAYFNATNNPNLPCIQVDNVAYSVANWTQKDPASSYNTVCNKSIETISPTQMGLTAYPNPSTGALSLSFDAVEGDFVVEVRNVVGALLYSQNHTSTSLVELELDGPSGIYFVSVKTAKREALLKVLKL